MASGVLLEPDRRAPPGHARGRGMSPSVRRSLYAARELLEIRLLVAALDVASTALRLEHPSVDTLADPTDPPTLCAARLLLARIRSLPAPSVPTARPSSARSSSPTTTASPSDAPAPRSTLRVPPSPCTQPPQLSWLCSDALSKKLPLYQHFKARLLVEVQLAVDQYETHPAALKVAAAGAARAGADPEVGRQAGKSTIKLSCFTCR